MKKLVLPIAVASMLLASCGGATSSLSREPEFWPEPTPSSLPASKESSQVELSSEAPEISAQNSASTVQSSAPSVTVADLNADLSNFISLYMTKLSSFKSYKAVTKGSTKAKVLFIETDQSIDVTSIKADYCYLKNESHGAVDSVHESYFHNGQALVKNQNETKFALVEMNQYLDSYGVNPYGYNIEGYSISGDAIASISKSETEKNAFTIEFDKEKATNNVRIQMKAFGSLDDYPVFASAKVTIFVQDDFTPIKYQLVADYNAKRFGVPTDCHQEYEVTFSDFDSDIAAPNLAEIRAEYSF